jgi:hypothetical protein
MRYTISYQYGTYHGTEIVFAEEGEDPISKMWANFSRRGLLTLPMAYKSARIVEAQS